MGKYFKPKFVSNRVEHSDPGHDDAFAIMLAGHSPELELIGISTSAGNQTVAKTTRNALNVLNISGLGHIPVVPGQNQPLLRPAVYFTASYHLHLVRFL